MATAVGTRTVKPCEITTSRAASHLRRARRDMDTALFSIALAASAVILAVVCAAALAPEDDE